jgi:indolepyruvate ferredoxin oxidoreductase alpha subunit
LQSNDKIIVIEELDPIIENEIMKINPNIEIIGKEVVPEVGELGPENIEIALSKIFGFKIPKNLQQNIEKFDQTKIPFRIPYWCPGCPHRETFKAIKQVFGDDVIYGGDIGCYMIGAYPPAKMLDYVVSMGAGTGVAHGISKSTQKKTIAFIGDSTFFHAGIPALINAVFNKSNVLIVALDNRCTAMTGHQPHPGTGLTGQDEKTKELKIEEIAKACGADNVETINVYNQKEAIAKIKEISKKQGVSVLIAKGECVIYKKKRLKKERENPSTRLGVKEKK